jgi:hypothetical protein
MSALHLAGYDASTAAEWAKNVHVWGKLLEGHPDARACIAMVQAMSTMLKEAMSRQPNVDVFNAAAKTYHRSLTHFPKVTPRIYEHALLMHVPTLLSHGSLLDGSSWFLEAYNKVWKQQIMRHSNGGGGKVKESGVAAEVSESGRHRLLAERAAREDLSALKALWACSHPDIRAYAAKWGQDGMESSM